MINKTPIVILEIIEPVIKNNPDFFKLEVNENGFIKLIDKDYETEFFFEFLGQRKSKSQKDVYDLAFKPGSKKNPKEAKSGYYIESVGDAVAEWVNLIITYRGYKTIFEDPILKSYQENFETEFEIVDEDADEMPFNLNQQILLDQYLESFKKKLAELKENKFLHEEDMIKEIEADISETQRNLTKEPKKKIIRRISKFCAKAQKVGLEFIKELAIQTFIEFFKQKMIG